MPTHEIRFGVLLASARRVSTSVFKLVVALLLGLALLNVPVADAVTYGPYTKNCGSQYVRVQSYARYTVYHYYPSGTLQVQYYAPYYVLRDTHTGSQSTSWKVWANDAIQVGSTYAYCVSYG